MVIGVLHWLPALLEALSAPSCSRVEHMSLSKAVACWIHKRWQLPLHSLHGGHILLLGCDLRQEKRGEMSFLLRSARLIILLNARAQCLNETSTQSERKRILNKNMLKSCAGWCEEGHREPWGTWWRGGLGDVSDSDYRGDDFVLFFT